MRSRPLRVTATDATAGPTRSTTSTTVREYASRSCGSDEVVSAAGTLGVEPPSATKRGWASMGGMWVPRELFSMRGDNRTMSGARTHALILFAHGARDARWGQTLQSLRKAVLARRPQSRVELAFLEFQSPTLAAALADAVAAGCTRIDIAPVFWASGGHIVNDLPPMLEA